MKRGRRLLLVAHCVLNQNAVVHPLARAAGALPGAVSAAMEAGVGFYQLPCPETLFRGLTRAPETLAGYDTAEYRRLCARLVRRVGRDLEPLLADGCAVAGVLGIAGSPSCSPTHPQGVWLRQLLAEPWLSGVPVLGVPECEEEPDQDRTFQERLRAVLAKG
ncbi:MAG: hypothetical protein ACM3RP_05445 [Chitinophagales bacterium]